MHVIYQLLSYLVFAAASPLFLLHPKLKHGLARRLGLYPKPPPWPSGPSPRIWFHGASAGDLIALHPIMTEVRALSPGATLVASAMTASGHEIATKRLAGLVSGVTYVPWDVPGATQRAVEAIAPDVLVLEYTELWPNLIHAAKLFGARVVLTNGRLSEAKLGRYRLLFAVFGNQLAKLDLLLMREDVEADRARLLGAPKDRVFVTGNTKFDNVAKPPPDEVIGALSAAFGGRGEPVFVAGSTHEGEERELFRCLKVMREVDPATRMIVAPRYVERAPKLLALAKAEGLTAAERSRAQAEPSVVAGADVMVLDTMGELNAAYALATLVFVGGSFVPRGGQNILEPAGHGRPVLFGPHMANFRDSVEVLLGRGAIQVLDPAQLAKVAKELLARPAELQSLGEMAKAAVAKARGAARRNAEKIVALAAKA